MSINDKKKITYTIEESKNHISYFYSQKFKFYSIKYITK